MTLAEALLARLRSAMDPVYDGEVPTDDKGQPLSQRYAVLYAAVPVRQSEDLASVADRHVFRWQITSVGTDRRQAEWVAVLCRDAVLDAPLLADGWELGAVEHSSSVPIRRDDDVPGGDLFYAIDTYRLTATR